MAVQRATAEASGSAVLKNFVTTCTKQSVLVHAEAAWLAAAKLAANVCLVSMTEATSSLGAATPDERLPPSAMMEPPPPPAQLDVSKHVIAAAVTPRRARLTSALSERVRRRG